METKTETWIRRVNDTELQVDPWHLRTDEEGLVTACGQDLEEGPDVEGHDGWPGKHESHPGEPPTWNDDLGQREQEQGVKICQPCYQVYLAGQVEISDAPLAEDYEPLTMDPSHVSVTTDGDAKMGPRIDTDAERRAYIEGWLASSSSTESAERESASKSYQAWVEADRPRA